MSTTDRQRIAAVKTLEEMGNTFGGDKWFGPDATAQSPEVDALHALLVLRADRLEGCTEGRRSRSFRPSSAPSLLLSRGVGLMARPRAAISIPQTIRTPATMLPSATKATWAISKPIAPEKRTSS